MYGLSVSNAVDWHFNLNMIDTSTGGFYAPDGLDIEVEIRRGGGLAIKGGTQDGVITLHGDGRATGVFPESMMRGLEAGDYDLYARASLGSASTQIAICKLEVLEGGFK